MFAEKTSLPQPQPLASAFGRAGDRTRLLPIANNGTQVVAWPLPVLAIVRCVSAERIVAPHCGRVPACNPTRLEEGRHLGVLRLRSRATRGITSEAVAASRSSGPGLLAAQMQPKHPRRTSERRPTSRAAVDCVAEAEDRKVVYTIGMSGQGNGARGLGQGGATRHRKILRDNIQGITGPAIRRLARRAGIIRISGLVYHETRAVLRVFLDNVIRDAVVYTEYGHRKTVTSTDVLLCDDVVKDVIDVVLATIDVDDGNFKCKCADAPLTRLIQPFDSGDDSSDKLMSEVNSVGIDGRTERTVMFMESILASTRSL
ncbi:hypothetical protein ON010_g12048 [Phytophthora cinnamomi]|nr:hypothetical protein ON010_g12048 [Phytophthora cinnamomi]